ncbi:11777_t:CDS:2, partial [Scutellospora calospora]
LALNTSNINAEGNTIVSDIYIEQVIYWLKTNYLTITAEKSKVKEIIKQQFFQSFLFDNKLEVRYIGLKNLISILLPKLEQNEKQKTELILKKYNSNSYLVISYLQSIANTKDLYITNNTDMTKKEIENFIKSIIISTQTQFVL